MFYLVLRGLVTIEDMTIPNGVKQPLPQSFQEKTVTPGWNFKENGPNEKDRQLLVEYDTTVKEMNLLAPEYVSPNMMRPFNLTFIIGTEISLSTSVKGWKLTWPTSPTKPLRRTRHTLLPLKNMTFTATTSQASSARAFHAFG